MRELPVDWDLKHDVLIYPEKRERIEGDVLEIGPGRGDLLLSLAEASPERKFVAIEWGKRRYYRLIPRIEKRGLTNITLMQGRGQVLIPIYVPMESFERVYVLFPDPWPKKRHIPHRLLSPSFMAVLACVLKPGGDLVVATDFQRYAEWVVDNARFLPVFESMGTPYCDLSKIPDYAPTFFEQKWRDEGRDIYYMRYRKCTRNIALDRSLADYKPEH